jgi:hypothetical protein
LQEGQHGGIVSQGQRVGLLQGIAQFGQGARMFIQLPQRANALLATVRKTLLLAMGVCNRLVGPI